MMAASTKSPVRVAIEADILAALAQATRPLSVDDLYPRCESAEDKAMVARVVSHLRAAGEIACGPDLSPGEPGGMDPKTKGARAVKSYRLPSAAESVAVMKGQIGAKHALRAAYPDVVETFDRLEVSGAFGHMDTAAESHDGDELAWTPDAPAVRIPTAEDLDDEWAPDVARTLPDRPCTRCNRNEEMVEIVSGMDAALLDYADRIMSDDPVWAQLRAVRQAMVEVL